MLVSLAILLKEINNVQGLQEHLSKQKDIRNGKINWSSKRKQYSS